MNYEYYMKKVDDLVSELKPDAPHESLASYHDVWIDMFSERLTKQDNIELPGWDFFNKITRGVRMNEFTILCGPTGAGKTTLLANMAAILAANSVPSFIGSVEIGRTDFMNVLASILTERDPETPWTAEEMNKAGDDHRLILQSDQHYFCKYDSRVPHRQLLADMLCAHEMMGTKIALIDNLNFLMDVGAKDQIAAMDQAIHDFVVFVKKVPMHVFMVMHPKKTENGRVTNEFDIKGSSTAVQEAANVILWNRVASPDDAPIDDKSEWCREMKFCKIRKNGRAAGCRVVFAMGRNSPLLRERRILE